MSQATATSTDTATCFWKCGDQAEGHTHYGVLVRDAKTNKLLGRLTPSGHTNHLTVYAMVLSKSRAEEIATEINTKSGDEFIAKAVKF